MEYYTKRELQGIINTFSSGDITTDCPVDVAKMTMDVMKITDQLEREEAEKKLYTHIMSKVSKDDLIDFLSREETYYLWEYVDKSVQSEIIMDYIKTYNDNVNMIVAIWELTNGDVQLENIELFDSLIRQAQGFDLAELWGKSDPRIQLERRDIFLPLIIDKLIEDGIQRESSQQSAIDRGMEIQDEELEYELKSDARGTLSVAWEGTTKELQELLFEDLLEKVKKYNNGIISIWNSTNPDIQNKHSEIIEIIEEKIDEYIKYEQRIKREKADREPGWSFGRDDISPFNDDLDDLEYVDREEKRESAEKNIILLLEIYAGANEEIKKKELSSIISKLKCIYELNNGGILDKNFVSAKLLYIWKNTEPNIQTKQDFDDIIKILENKSVIRSLPTDDGVINRMYTDIIWENTSKEIQEQRLNELLEKYKDNPDVIRGIFKYTDLSIEISNEKLIEILHMVYSDKTDEYIEMLANNYLQLENINSELRRTLNLDLITPEIINEFGIEIVARMSNYEGIQSKFIENINDKENIEIIKKMWQKTNDISCLNTILENMSKYSNLLEKLDIENMNEEDIENIIDFLLQNEEERPRSNREAWGDEVRSNLFGIKTAEQLKNFNSIKTDICNKILEGNTEDLPELIIELSEGERKKLAILELTYGIDLESAKKLVERFDFKLDDSRLSKEQQQIKRNLDNIRSILESDNIEQFIPLIENSTGELRSYVEFQTGLIDLMEEVYSETLYIPQEHLDSILPNEQYTDEDGQIHDIEIYEVRDSFKMFARSEGAYNPNYQEPDNYYDDINRPNATYHRKLRKLYFTRFNSNS